MSKSEQIFHLFIIHKREIFGELKERILNFFILSDGKFYLKDKERKELNKENVKQRLKRKNLKEIKLNFHSKIKEKNL